MSASAPQQPVNTRPRLATARRVLPLLVAIGMVVIGPPANAAHDHYGESARKVASEINCKNFRRTGAGEMNKDGGICWVKGKRVNVLTFARKGKQAEWNRFAELMLPRDFYWANGKGAIVVAKNGNRPAAVIGARRLPGKVKHGS